MGNSVLKSRRRPRVRSASFLTLWWLIAREAAWTAMGLEELHPRRSRLGVYIVRAPLAELRRMVRSGHE